MFWVRVFCCLVARKLGRVAKPVFWSHLFFVGTKNSDSGLTQTPTTPSKLSTKADVMVPFLSNCVAVFLLFHHLGCHSNGNKRSGKPQQFNTEFNLNGEKSGTQAKPQVQQTGRCESHINTEWGGKIEFQGRLNLNVPLQWATGV